MRGKVGEKLLTMRIFGSYLGIFTTELRQWNSNGDFTCAVDNETIFTTKLNVGSNVVIRRGVQ